MIKSATIPKQEKEKVLLALTNTSHSSNKILHIIENHLGHKVSDIVPFLSEPASSSSSSASKPKQQEGEASSSKKSVIKGSKTNKKSTDVETKNPPHNTKQNTTMSRSFWKKQNRTFLIDQLESHHGIILTKEQKMGGIDKDGKKFFFKKKTNDKLSDMMIEV